MLRDKDIRQLDPVRIARRLLYVNDISLHSTSYTIQNVILDVYGCEESKSLVASLRKECELALREAGGSWTWDAVQKLKLVDATIREFMRLTPFASIGLPRTASLAYITLSIVTDRLIIIQVMDPKDITTVLAVSLDPIHKYDSLYADDHKFKPFRFANPKSDHNNFKHFNPACDGDNK